MPTHKPVSPNRDSVTTIRDDGSRRYLHPADSHGRFTWARRLSGVGMIAFFIALPWIHIGGYPAVFLDVAERRFHLFGYTLAAQDMWLLFFLITGLGFTLFFLTSLFGRLWCGWACPQTVFLDHVFRRVERFLEGDAIARRRLEAAPWTTGKIARCALKHLLYIILSAGIAHIFLAYFVSLPALWKMMTHAPGAHIGSFVFIAAFTGILYFNFAWFREQLCIIICPYGRIQSALIDDNSLVIGYDTTRGEPRGKVNTPNAGACIDCNRCVQVCPTGIDIRQGLQIECIGCAACVDACDEVMTKLKRPRGLVRYDSFNGFAGTPTRLLRPRTIIYSLLMCIGAAAALFALSTVKPAYMGITRMTGSPYYMDDGYLRNQYNLRLVNKANKPVTIKLAPGDATPANILINGLEMPVELPANGETVRPVVVRMPLKEFSDNFRLRFTASDTGGTFVLNGATEFLGPDAFFLKMTTPQPDAAPANK